MPLARCLSFIYAVCRHNAKAFYPPAQASYPQAPVYMNLQPPRHTARTSLHGRWALTPPSHPYPLLGGYFLLRYSTLAGCFLLGSEVLCAARTFLLCLVATATDCPTVFYSQSLLISAAKIVQKRGTIVAIAARFVAENKKTVLV